MYGTFTSGKKLSLVHAIYYSVYKYKYIFVVSQLDCIFVRIPQEENDLLYMVILPA